MRVTCRAEGHCLRLRLRWLRLRSGVLVDLRQRSWCLHWRLHSRERRNGKRQLLRSRIIVHHATCHFKCMHLIMLRWIRRLLMMSLCLRMQMMLVLCWSQSSQRRARSRAARFRTRWCVPRRRPRIATRRCRRRIGKTNSRRRSREVPHIVRRKIERRSRRHTSKVARRHGKHLIIQVGVKVGATTPRRRSRLPATPTTGSKVLLRKCTIPAVVCWRSTRCCALGHVWRRASEMSKPCG